MKNKLKAKPYGNTDSTIINLVPERVVAEINVSLELAPDNGSDIEAAFLTEVGNIIKQLQKFGMVLDYSIAVDRDAEDEEVVEWTDLADGGSVE